MAGSPKGPALAFWLVGVRAALVAPAGYKCVKIIASWSHARRTAPGSPHGTSDCPAEVSPAARRPEGIGRDDNSGWLSWSSTLIGFLILGGFEAWRDSATFDEPVYVSSGVAAILHHDVADNAEHPPLFKVLAALPVLAVGPVVPADGHWNVNNERTYSARFVQAQMRAGTMRRVTFASRLVPLLECGLLALALYGLASLLFGAWSGVVAALLWLLDPLVLGLGHLDGVDLPFALTTVLVSWALVRWLRRPRRAVVRLAGCRLWGGRVGSDHGNARRGRGARRHRGGGRCVRVNVGWHLWRQPPWSCWWPGCSCGRCTSPSTRASSCTPG